MKNSISVNSILFKIRPMSLASQFNATKRLCNICNVIKIPKKFF